MHENLCLIHKSYQDIIYVSTGANPKQVQILHPPVIKGVYIVDTFYLYQKVLYRGIILNSYEGMIIATRKGQRMEIKDLNLSDEQLALVQKYVQSETDKVRTDYSQKLKTANDEIARLKPVEKSESEKALEERITALEAREREVANKEKAMTIANKLKEKELPAELAKYLNVGDDMDKTIEELGSVFGNYFLNGTNKPGTHQTNKGITKADFKKMSYSQRAKLFQENPTLYNALNK